MKIIGTDNLARETVADHLLIGWLPQRAREDAEAICRLLNKHTCDNSSGTFYQVVEDDHRLSKGMEDLV